MDFGNELDFTHLCKCEPYKNWTYASYLEMKRPELYYKAILTHKELQELDILRKAQPQKQWTHEQFYKMKQQFKLEKEAIDNE